MTRLKTAVSTLLCLSLLGCAAGSLTLAAAPHTPALPPGLAPPDALVLTTSDLVPGDVLELVVDGLEPAESVHFAFSTTLGSGPCLGGFGGLCLDLVGPKRIGTATAGLAGTATLALWVPDSLSPGATVAFQALVDRDEDSMASVPVELEVIDPVVDADGDGYARDEDCDDADPAVHPGAREVCDGIDNDCDPDSTEAGVVTLDGHTNYSTITDAVTHAPSDAMVAVCEGTYVEDVEITPHGLTLWAPHGPDVTIVESAGGWRGPMRISAPEVTVDGFSIRGAIYSWYAVAVDDRDFVLQNSRVEDNEGDAINIQASGALILDTVISNSGTGISVGYADSGSGERLTLIDNYAAYGGAIEMHRRSDFVLLDSVVHSNRAAGNGGGVYVWDAVGEPSGRFEAIDCDFGIGATENTPDDAFSGATDKSYAAYSVGSSFVCTSASCY
jgi:hypothetical protein